MRFLAKLADVRFVVTERLATAAVTWSVLLAGVAGVIVLDAAVGRQDFVVSNTQQLLVAASASLKKGDCAGVQRTSKALLRADRDNLDIRKVRAQCLLQAGDIGAAVRDVRFVAINDPNTENFTSLANFEWSYHNRTRAVEAVRKASTFTHDAAKLVAMSSQLNGYEAIPEALAVLERVQLDSRDGNWYAAKAAAEATVASREVWEADYRQAVAHSGPEAKSVLLVRLGDTFFGHSYFTEALQAYGDAAPYGLGVDPLHVLLASADAANALHRPADTAKALRGALTIRMPEEMAQSLQLRLAAALADSGNGRDGILVLDALLHSSAKPTAQVQAQAEALRQRLNPVLKK